MTLDRDWQLRLAAMQRLTALRDAGGGLVTAAALEAGFEFEGERIPLWSSRKGIWRPRQLGKNGPALTIFTAPRVAGRAPAYHDEVAADDRGWFGYKYEGTDPGLWTNVAMRRAMELQRPLIYLYGVTKGVYEPIFPVYVTGDDPATLTFKLQADVPTSVVQPSDAFAYAAAPRREYQTVAVKRRIHQHRFRELVLSAYSKRCSMCSLGHVRLLDAAHIIADHDDRGLPEVPNGLALCKIHHSAYDENILGISADLVIHVRDDILREIDGPMLEHGLKRMEGTRIQVPRPERLRPNLEYLDERFRRFRAA
ncbi:MAG: HNH endonuclease [Gemmatimonadaceae bacterium]|nr:HNH endonuclease [Gemmatimonadaceae bacterium]